MDNQRRESYHSPRAVFPDLVTSTTQGLGYCCLWAFFRRYKRSTLVALRLGVDRSTVKRWRQRFRAGEFSCTKCPRCLKGRVEL